MNYDVIVVGAGLSGLTQAVIFKNQGLKVLVIDENNNIGGCSVRTKKGRFEFGDNYTCLFLNTDKEIYTLKNFMHRAQIDDDIPALNLPNLAHLITPQYDMTLPFGIESFKKTIEDYVKSAKGPLNIFFDLAIECKKALEYIDRVLPNIDYNYLKNNFNNFSRLCDLSVNKVWNIIKMPSKAIKVLNSFCLLWQTSPDELSFVTYSIFLYNALTYGLNFLNNGSYNVAISLSNSFLERGGEIKLNSRVTKLLIDDNKVNGVMLEDGTCYYSNKVIVNSNEYRVYHNLLTTNEVPKLALNSLHKRTLTNKMFTINIGLNRRASSLGLDDFLYLIYDTLDFKITDDDLKDLSLIALVHNNSNESSLKPGTSVITINTFFAKYTYPSLEEVFIKEETIAKQVISLFEAYTKTNISDFIEEIEIISPLSNVNSSIYDNRVNGFTFSNLDDILPRLLNKNNENYIDGLEIVSGFAGDAYLYASTYYITNKRDGAHYE